MAIGPSGVGSHTTTTVPAAIGPIKFSGISPMAIGPTAAIGPIERKAHIPRRLAYDDDGGSIGPAKRHQSGSSGIDGRKALSISPSGTNGRKALTIKLIVRTQKRLEAEEVPSQLKSA